MAKKKTNIKESIGIDIGTHSIKAVHLRRVGDSWKLLGSEVRSTIPEGIEYLPSDLRSDRFAPVLSAIIRSLKINPKKVKRLVTSLGGDNTSIKQIKTIYLPDDELESALFFEAKKHLPISGSEMILDYQVLNFEEKTNNMNILLAAATKDQLSEHTEILSSCNLVPGLVDIESLAVSNAVLLSKDIEDGVEIALNIGAHKTNMTVVGKGTKFFARDIQYGGYNFIKDLMNMHDIAFDQADNMLRDKGLAAEKSSGGGLSMLDITEKPTQESLAMEVKRSLRFYVKEAGNSDFKKILLMGGGAKIKGLAEYLSQNLNIPCEVFNPFINIDSSGQPADPQLAVAAGLAMRTD